MKRRHLTLLAAVLLTSHAASAQPTPQPAGQPTGPANPTKDSHAADLAAGTPTTPDRYDPKGKPPPSPYSLPFQLRPIAPLSVVRFDNSVAFYDDVKNPAAGTGTTSVNLLTVAYQVHDMFAPFARAGYITNAPATGISTGDFLNLSLGGQFGYKFTPELRFGAVLAVFFPVGEGSGNTPTPTELTAAKSGVLARNGMDNSMFATNDWSVVPGVDLAYVSHGFTAQIEATFINLIRAKGELVQPDAYRLNFTSGLHLGYFFHPMVSAGAELHHQRFLTTPTPVKTNEALRDTTTFTVGPRFHFKMGDKSWMRPGISYSMGLDDPSAASHYKIVQIDVPYNF